MADNTPVDPSQDPEAQMANFRAAYTEATGIQPDTNIYAPSDDPEAQMANFKDAYRDSVPESEIVADPSPVDTTQDVEYEKLDYAAYNDVADTIDDAAVTSPGTADIISGVNDARQQQTLSTDLGQQASSSDWRVRISLAKGAGYLYNAPQPGILQPLRSTNGVVFPYTPKIDMSYKANYQSYDLTHSNLRGYFYQNSQINDISISGHFTAQNTNQANYLLAVIHFLRSATKMFYGKDAQRGTPPPMVFLSGLGDYQFRNHPCLITSFNYNLPDDVDYIRAGVANNVGLNMATVSNVLNSAVASGSIGGYARLAAAFTTPGALPVTPFGSLATPNLASGAPTYVPTKMDISVTLLPVQSRKQMSQQFSLKDYANGNLLKGGFW